MGVKVADQQTETAQANAGNAAPAISPEVQQAAAAAKAATAKTPADLATMMASDPLNIEAYVGGAQKAQGNGFVQTALALASNSQAGTKASAIDHGNGAPQAPNSDKTAAALKAKWGAHPHKFSGYVDGSNAAELIIRDVLPQAVAFINSRAKANHHTFQISVAELTTNFLAEGGTLIADANMTQGIDGYGYLGIDTFMDRIAQLRPWLHPCIAEGRLERTEQSNEKEQKVHSIGNLTLIQGIYASAAMLALTKSMLEHDAKQLGNGPGHPGSISAMSDTEQFYFDTVYYNSGPGAGEQLLKNQGTNAAHRKWTKQDDPQFGRNSQYNATWRTSTYEQMRDSTVDHGRFRTAPDDVAKAGNTDVGSQIESMKQSITWMDQRIGDTEGMLSQAEQTNATGNDLDQLRLQLQQLRNERTGKIELLAELVRLHKPEAAPAATPAPATTTDDASKPATTTQ